MPKISEAKRETRRQEILDAALRCFSRDGFHTTTTADIVRESGVSQGTLYLYFATKEDIVVALADERHQGEDDPIRGLLALIELYGEGLTDPHRVAMQRVGIQGWGEALRNERIRKSAVEGLGTVRQAIERLIERAQHTGQIRAEVDPEAVARTLVATFQGLVLQVAWGEAVNLRACGQIVLDLIRALLTFDGRASFEAAVAEHFNRAN